MVKNIAPTRTLIRLPTMEYVSSTKPFAASCDCLFIKDRKPRETNPPPRLAVLRQLIIYRMSLYFHCSEQTFLR